MSSVPEFLYPHMMQEYYVAKLRRIAAARKRRRNRVNAPEAVNALRREVRNRLARSFGPFPEKTPLNLRITGEIHRPGYCIEKLVFESRPNFPVTANLYRPDAGPGPFPCVLGTCGHSQIGKAEPAYQAFAQALVHNRFMVLLYDPISQGERLQYPLPEGEPQPRGCCQEHNMMGNQMRLVGDFLGTWRTWDGIRALDALLQHPDADPKHVGLTGNSGGGTMSTYLNAFDDRFTMAAPSCFVTTYLHNLENELPADSEQIPPKILKLGLDMADFFVAQIPRPILLLGQKNDFFDTRGLRETCEELRRLYAILGLENRVELFIGPTDHGYSPHNRKAMTDFFCRTVGIQPVPTREPTIETPETLACTPGGQVWKTGARRVFDFTCATTEAIATNRKPLSTQMLSRRARQILRLPDSNPEPPYYRILRCRWADTPPYPAHSLFAVEVEPGIQAVLHQFGPHYRYHFAPPAAPVLHLGHISATQDVANGEAPVRPAEFFALDVRGIGQTRAFTCHDADFFAPYGNDYFYASTAIMLDTPLLGRRVLDCLRVLDLIQAHSSEKIHLTGRGLGAVVAAFAALLHPAVHRLTLRHALLAFQTLAQTPVHAWPLSIMPPKILRYFDLPDLYRCLDAKCRLRIQTPWGPAMTPLTPETAREQCEQFGIPTRILDAEN